MGTRHGGSWGVGVAGRINGQDRSPKADRREGGWVGWPERNYLPFVGRVSEHGRTYKGEGSTDGRRRGKLPGSMWGRVSVFYNDAPPSLPSNFRSTSERGELPSSGLLGSQSGSQSVSQAVIRQSVGKSVILVGSQQWFIVADCGRKSQRAEPEGSHHEGIMHDRAREGGEDPGGLS